MRVTVWKCDGCKVKLSEEDSSRERCFTLRTPHNARDLDLCRECWQKMCAAINLDPSPSKRDDE